MMNQTLKRCITVFLLASGLCACSAETAAPQTETAAPASVTGEDTSVTETASVDAGLTFVDLGGAEFHVLAKQEGSDSLGRWTGIDFSVTEENSEVINDSLYRRNLNLQEKFNCTIVNEYQAMGNSFSFTYYKAAAKLIQSGDTYYDLYMPTIQDCAKLSCDHMLWDLTMFEEIDLTQPWWNQVFTEATSIGDHVYYADGDIALTFMQAAYAILFNKQLIETYDLENPYTIVTDGKWTMDKLMEMSRSATEDLNGNGLADSEDHVGLLLLYNSGEAFYAATGSKLVTANEDGTLTFTGDSERSLNVMEKIYTIYTTKDVVIDCNVDSRILSSEILTLSPVERAQALFANGSSLFLFGTMLNIPAMRDMTTDFGILPLPKSDDSQSQYYSYVHTWASSAVAIPITAQNPNASAAFAEAAACYGAAYVTPAYYDVALKTKYARDEDSAAMLDLIYDNRWCDLGNLFDVGSVLSTMTSLITAGKNTFSSMIAKKEAKIDSTLAEISDAYLNGEG